METTKRSLAIAATCVLSSVMGITTITNIDSDTHTASALSYSTSEDISFTFAPTLSIGLSTDSLTIDNLVPGTTSDSNAVTVTVASNTPYGYVLSAGVGSTDDITSPYHNTSDLVHDNSTTQVPTTNKFSSIATSASLSTLTTDNTWGYSTSTDGGTSWSTYSGLSHTATKPLLDISDPATPSTIDFKIAARSASTQASGTYNNVITFYAVGKPEPLTIDKLQYMQDFKTLAETDKESVLASMSESDQYTLKDSRDEKPYYISKLSDNNVWMTQNLDFDIEAGNKYTPADTDIPSSWIPSSGTGESWSVTKVDMSSSDAGNQYCSTVTKTPTACPSSGNPHYHIGNYYNWTAAVALRNSSSYTADEQDVDRSVCPASWRLPTYSGDKSYQNLISKQGLIAGRDSGNMQKGPVYFIYGGYLNDKSNVTRGMGGSYWTSVVSSASYAYSLYFNQAGALTSQSSRLRSNGQFIRCVLR